MLILDFAQDRDFFGRDMNLSRGRLALPISDQSVVERDEDGLSVELMTSAFRTHGFEERWQSTFFTIEKGRDLPQNPHFREVMD